MPFDGKDFALPAVVTDEMLQRLIEARVLLSDPNKWIQGTYCSEAGDRFCALGAVGVRQLGPSGHREHDQVADDTAIFLRALIRDRYEFVPHFNDAPTTNHADVLALFDRAISARRMDVSNA